MDTKSDTVTTEGYSTVITNPPAGSCCQPKSVSTYNVEITCISCKRRYKMVMETRPTWSCDPYVEQYSNMICDCGEQLLSLSQVWGSLRVVMQTMDI